MVSDDDPRLQGQERYLQGATLTLRPWSSDRPDWDHDHCDFCWVHLGSHIFDDDPETQLEGWATADSNHWVCRTCFEDFRERFGWQTGPQPGQG
jgi:hypothetical protein